MKSSEAASQFCNHKISKNSHGKFKAILQTGRRFQSAMHEEKLQFQQTNKIKNPTDLHLH